MLGELHIENIAVIRQLTLSFSKGFTVLSGETGAGKSVILEAIRLILGERGDKELVRHGEKTAYVSAMFSDISDTTEGALSPLSLSRDEEGCIFIERTRSAEGKSTAKWNGRSIPLSLLRQATPHLLMIHGQNATGALMREDTQRELLDRYADTSDARAVYLPLYQAYTALCEEETALLTASKEKARMTELLRYQIHDIESVSPKPDEEEKLFEKRLLLRNREKITKQASFVYKALRGAEKGSVHELLCRTLRSLSALSEYLPETDELIATIEECVDRTDGVAEEIFAYAEEDGENPIHALDKVESRLEEYARLHRKYGEKVADIIAFYEEKKEELARYEGADDRLSELKKEKKALILRIKKAAEELRQLRIEAAARLSRSVMEELRYLDMPKVVFEICVDELPIDAYTAFGGDRVVFTVAANPGEPPVALADTASGGEMSRIMLALKSALAEKDAVDSVIYDEVDAGVSGKTARKIGLLLREAAHDMQIFSVTHSAQIASLADNHYLIRKKEIGGRAETQAYLLKEEERIEELARIIGGLTVTDVQREAARALRSGQEDTLSLD